MDRVPGARRPERIFVVRVPRPHHRRVDQQPDSAGLRHHDSFVEELPPVAQRRTRHHPMPVQYGGVGTFPGGATDTREPGHPSDSHSSGRGPSHRRASPSSFRVRRRGPPDRTRTREQVGKPGRGRLLRSQHGRKRQQKRDNAGHGRGHTSRTAYLRKRARARRRAQSRRAQSVPAAKRAASVGREVVPGAVPAAALRNRRRQHVSRASRGACGDVCVHSGLQAPHPIRPEARERSLRQCGSRAAALRSRFRLPDETRRFQSVISGICTSIRTRSYEPCFHRSTASLPFPATLTVQPSASRPARNDFAIHRIVFRHQNLHAGRFGPPSGGPPRATSWLIRDRAVGTRK